jgi:hypothetical protein
VKPKHSARGPWVVYRTDDRTYWKQGMWVRDFAEAQRMAKDYAATLERQLTERGLTVYATKYPGDVV